MAQHSRIANAIPGILFLEAHALQSTSVQPTMVDVCKIVSIRVPVSAVVHAILDTLLLVVLAILSTTAPILTEDVARTVSMMALDFRTAAAIQGFSYPMTGVPANLSLLLQQHLLQPRPNGFQLLVYLDRRTPLLSHVHAIRQHAPFVIYAQEILLATAQPAELPNICISDLAILHVHFSLIQLPLEMLLTEEHARLHRQLLLRPRLQRQQLNQLLLQRQRQRQLTIV